MQKRKIAFLVMTLVPICSFSQNTSSPTMIDTIRLEIPVNPNKLVSITEKQLTTANLIFLEHEQMSQELPLLRNKISNLEKIDSTWQHTDSIQKSKEKEYISTINTSNANIKSLTKTRNLFIGTTVTSIALLILSLIL